MSLKSDFRNYFIMFLVVAVVLSISFAYKYKRANALNHFPVSAIPEKPGEEVSVYLIFSFSRQDCLSCMEIIDTLNTISAPFWACGIAPDDQIADEAGFRQATRAGFKLYPLSQFKNVIPLYTPSLLGVTRQGRVLFILPGAPDQVAYFKDFLYSFYAKAHAKGVLTI